MNVGDFVETLLGLLEEPGGGGAEGLFAAVTEVADVFGCGPLSAAPLFAGKEGFLAPPGPGGGLVAEFEGDEALRGVFQKVFGAARIGSCNPSLSVLRLFAEARRALGCGGMAARSLEWELCRELGALPARVQAPEQAGLLREFSGVVQALFPADPPVDPATGVFEGFDGLLVLGVQLGLPERLEERLSVCGEVAAVPLERVWEYLKALPARALAAWLRNAAALLEGWRPGKVAGLEDLTFPLMVTLASWDLVLRALLAQCSPGHRAAAVLLRQLNRSKPTLGTRIASADTLAAVLGLVVSGQAVPGRLGLPAMVLRDLRRLLRLLALQARPGEGVAAHVERLAGARPYPLDVSWKAIQGLQGLPELLGSVSTTPGLFLSYLARAWHLSGETPLLDLFDGIVVSVFREAAL